MRGSFAYGSGCDEKQTKAKLNCRKSVHPVSHCEPNHDKDMTISANLSPESGFTLLSIVPACTKENVMPSPPRFSLPLSKSRRVWPLALALLLTPMAVHAQEARHRAPRQRT